MSSLYSAQFNTVGVQQSKQICHRIGWDWKRKNRPWTDILEPSLKIKATCFVQHVNCLMSESKIVFLLAEGRYRQEVEWSPAAVIAAFLTFSIGVDRPQILIHHHFSLPVLLLNMTVGRSDTNNYCRNSNIRWTKQNFFENIWEEVFVSGYVHLCICEFVLHIWCGVAKDVCDAVQYIHVVGYNIFVH